MVWLKAWAGCVLVLGLIVTVVQLQLMYWSQQLLRILKRQHRSAKKSKVENEKLLSGVSGTTTVAKGIIKESKSQENLQAPNVPVRSTSQGTTNALPAMVQNQVWVPALQAIPVMFTNGQVMMQTTQNPVPHQNPMNFHSGYEKPLPKITDFQRQFRGNDESLELEEQQATIDLSSETDSKLGKSIENEIIHKYRPKSPKIVKKGSSENRSGSSQKSHQTESTFVIDEEKSHEFSWRITESPNLPPRNPSNSSAKNRENEKTHLYEPINYDLATKNQAKTPSEIKQLYREIRPGRLQENSKTQKSTVNSQTSNNSQSATAFNESKNPRVEELRNSKAQNWMSSSTTSSSLISQNSKTKNFSVNSQTSKNSQTPRFNESNDLQIAKKQNWASSSPSSSSQNSQSQKSRLNSQTTRFNESSESQSTKLTSSQNLQNSQNSRNRRFETSIPTTKNSQNSASVRFDESQNTTQTTITKSSRNVRLEKSSQNSSGSTGYPQSTIESPTIPQPGTTNRGQSSGYVNIPMPFQVHEKSTLDRTREWVTSQESLIPKPLPPKPNLVPIEPTNSIPYGYENVLPISQRFKEQPYSILSNMSNTNETCTTLTSDDDESEYLTRGDLTNNLKFAIKQRTIVEEDDPNSYRKTLTPETSI